MSTNNIVCGFNGCNTPSKQMKIHKFTHFRNDFQKDFKYEIAQWQQQGHGGCIERDCKCNSKNKYDFSRHYFSKHVYETYVPSSKSESESSIQILNYDLKLKEELQNDIAEVDPASQKTGSKQTADRKLEQVMDIFPSDQKTEENSSIQNPNNDSKEEMKNENIDDIAADDVASQKILLDETGLYYICQTYDRFSHVAMILV